MAVPAPQQSESMPERPVTISVIVDVEEEFDWNAPFSPANVSVSALAALPRAQRIFDRHGIVPAYLMTYPVVTSPLGRDVIRPILEAGRCEIGAHLHPWVTPPIEEAFSAGNSYPSNLPAELEDRKIGSLVKEIDQRFANRPRIYKAGRYGLDLARAATLVKHGFQVDASVMPYASYADHDSGPDFFGLPDEPFWLNLRRRLLAVPTTQSLIGPARKLLAPSSQRWLFGQASRAAKLPSLLSRLGLLERVRLSPEGTTLAEMKRLVDWRVRHGARSLCLSFHSPSLAPGFTPYAKTEEEVEELLSRLDGILAHVTQKLGAVPVSVLDGHAAENARLDAQEEDAAREVRFSGTTGRPTRILLVAGFFPPRAPMGAVRTAKLAEHWRAAGADVRVLAIDTEGPAPSADPPHGHAHYVAVKEPGTLVTSSIRAIRRLAPSRKNGGSGAAGAEGVPTQDDGLDSIKTFYRQVVGYPDRYRQWIRAATRTALSWAPDWKPDIIYCSSPPHSGQVAAARLSKALGVPWISELRDLWAGNPYDERHPWVRPFYDSLAQRTLSRASGVVVVSTLSAAYVQAMTGRPPVVSYNGYDPADFEGLEQVEPFDPQRLTIIHAGVIYAGRRDPSPLLEAIASLGAGAADIRALFFHDANGEVAALAARHGLGGSVEIRPSVPRREILRLERQVDVLLECRWLDRAGDGVIPGKLFEYIGARRPILSLGSPTAEAAEIIRDNGFGLVSNDPAEIADRLRSWLEEKRRQGGRLPDLGGRAHEGFSRAAQFRLVDAAILHQLKASLNIDIVQKVSNL